MSTLTIDQLTHAVAETFDRATLPGPHSARVREVPDKRTIRYYTTLGLLDRPAEMRGRVAYYGRRHLLQLVAIKRLQATGLSLVDIQQKLAGASDSTLSRLADLPKGFWEQLVARIAGSNGAAPARSSPDDDGSLQSLESSERFWEVVPNCQAPPMAEPADHGLSGDAITRRAATLLSLADGVTLVLEGVAADSLDESQLARLAPHLHRLLGELRELGLIPRQAE